MIDLLFATGSQTTKLAQPATIKTGGMVAVRVTFDAAPNNLTSLSLALGTDAAPPSVLAYTDAFTNESETVWTAQLDASDTRLATFMASLLTAAVDAELTAVIDGETQVCPNVSVTVQRRIVSGDPTGSGGPSYYTESQVDTLLALKASLDGSGNVLIGTHARLVPISGGVKIQLSADGVTWQDGPSYVAS